jgi:hypothetical protein
MQLRDLLQPHQVKLLESLNFDKKLQEEVKPKKAFTPTAPKPKPKAATPPKPTKHYVAKPEKPVVVYRKKRHIDPSLKS